MDTCAGMFIHGVRGVPRMRYNAETVKYIFQHASDPLTPGWAATKDAERLSFDEATDLPDIPVVPVAYRDAEPFLKALAGPNVPSAWQGGLPFAYHIGPGPAKVRIKVRL